MQHARVIAFTDHGMQTGERLRSLIPDMDLVRCPRGGLSNWTARSFESADVIIYIGAVGIAVRAIAPHIEGKLHDPAVLVIDELGKFVIPILSGHVGGANAAAEIIADDLGATAVITTATDLNHKFAVDVWATQSGLTIANKDGIKEISSRILRGEDAYIYCAWPINGTAPEHIVPTSDAGSAHAVVSYHSKDGCMPDQVLRLIPRCLYAGIGCRRGIAREAIEEAWMQVMSDYKLAPEAVAGVTSIDIKAGEPGLLEFCSAHGWSLKTYTKDELNAVPGEFHGSEFVKKTVGVDSVCERSCMHAATETACSAPGADSTDDAAVRDTDMRADSEGGIAEDAVLIVPKTSKNGVTVAVALAAPRLTWQPTSNKERIVT